MDFFELLILIFILAPLLEAILKQRKAGGGDETPPHQAQRRPGETGTDAQGRGGTATADRTATGAGQASDMIPAELWEVLTGQRRPEPVPAESDEEWDRAADEVGWEAEEWEPETEPRSSRWDTIKGPDEPVRDGTAPVATTEIGESDMHALPEARSLETIPPPPRPRPMPVERTPDPERRHQRFHRTLEGLSAPVQGYRRGPLAMGLDDPAELRRAFILHTLLGPPKSLE